ncbi:hypothetical protein FOHLNKBM_3762 [Methylobacterium longum]|nr:hypothetical protein FOHLNKBM_3762 [Methylobacterium longum]
MSQIPTLRRKPNGVKAFLAKSFEAVPAPGGAGREPNAQARVKPRM